VCEINKRKDKLKSTVTFITHYITSVLRPHSAVTTDDKQNRRSIVDASLIPSHPPSSSSSVERCIGDWIYNHDHDSYSRRGSGRGLYANVDQSPLSGRGHVTPLDQSRRLSLNCSAQTTHRANTLSPIIINLP